MYKKRQGLSGIRGALYETKLLSLIYFRAKHDDSIEEFHLGTNVDEIGQFDDVCFRAKVKGDKPIAIFMLTRHRENNVVTTLNSKNDLIKYYDSYLKIRHAFAPSNKNVLFKGDFSDTECLFVIYTNGKDDRDIHNTYDGDLASHLNDLIGTGGYVSQPAYNHSDVEPLYQIVLEEQLTTLARQMAKYICDEVDPQMLMNHDYYIILYHVLLAKNVFSVSEIQPDGHRIATFRDDFFDIGTGPLDIFKNTLCTEIFKKRNLQTENAMTDFLTNPSVIELSKLIGSVIMFKNGMFEFLDNLRSEHDRLLLNEVNSSPLTVKEAVKLAMHHCLPSLAFKVPATFGNKDLAVRGNDEKIEKRLNHLTSKILDLIAQSAPNKVITIDESLGSGFLQLNGGLASAVGNILVYDDTSNSIKFIKSSDSLENVASRLFAKLESQIENMHEFEFNVKVKLFPKLSITSNDYDEDLVKNFCSKLLFYTNQADECGVEEILKAEINDYQRNENLHNVALVSPDVVFLRLHDKIQKWWMSPKEACYLTKESELI